MANFNYGLLKPERGQLRIIALSCLYILFFPKAILAAQLPTDAFKISVSVQSFEYGEIQNYNLKMIQPYRFDIVALNKIMSSLAYQKRGVSWSNKRRVFNTALTRRLAPMIRKNFLLADRNQRIVFRVKNASGKTILAGDTFLTFEGLHWRLTAIQKKRRTVDDFSVSGFPWRLVPLTHQSYKTKEKIKGLTQDLTNWVVFNKIKPDSKGIIQLPLLSEEKQPVRPGPQSLDIKNRLNILEDLKQDGLINDEEYHIKRQKILDDL
ncbi:MAG: hypothetical protein NPINA01_11090 [Nitrospinaceae bacterium]|nr:MAG: hypothetical protein NPINA01_11090 [Nitrospinaceae bacterium]